MQRFIVGTGRCGSTLLSKMLQEHPDTLSIIEFFSTLDRDGVFLQGEFDGPQVAAILARGNLLNDLVVTREPFFASDVGHSYRREFPEYGRKAVRFPGFQMVLSQLCENPEQAYEEAIAVVRAWPRRTLNAHWLALFEWMTQRFGKQLWLERSGVSIEYAGNLIRWFPKARYIHIHRDGPTTALACRAFRHFVLYCSFFTAPPSNEELQQMLKERFDPTDDPVLRRMTTGQPSLEEFGRYWSWQIARGYHDLIQLPPDQFMDVRYEDLVGDTRHTLERIAQFFELPARSGWIDRAAAMIDPEVTPDRAHALSNDEMERLVTACRPGQTLLGRDVYNGFEDTMQRLRRAVDAAS
ncbi:MAG: sulfotransferase [Steroidobacteraceae bacterium]